jgi:hypothetical protein
MKPWQPPTMRRFYVDLPNEKNVETDYASYALVCQRLGHDPGPPPGYGPGEKP